MRLVVKGAFHILVLEGVARAPYNRGAEFATKHLGALSAKTLDVVSG